MDQVKSVISGVGRGVLLWVALGLVLPATGAAAPHVLLGGFGSFGNPEALAVDPASHQVYVFDHEQDAIERFDSAGKASSFSASQPYVDGNRLTGTAEGAFSFLSGASEMQIAVAPAGSPGGTAGDLYVTENGAGAVDVFDSAGNYLGRITEAGGSTFSEACGVAVDPAGNLYVADFGGAVSRYVPSANPPTNGDYDSQLTGLTSPCAIGASASTLYASTWSSGPATAYPLSLFPGGGKSADASAAGTVLEDGGAPVESTALAVDGASGEAFVDEGDQVAVFDSSNSLLERFGAGTNLGESHGVAVDGGLGSAYVAAPSAGEVDVFGPPPPPAPPTVSELSVSGITADEAIFKARVNPNSVSTAYHFEYVDDADFQASGFAAATSTPVPDAEIGAGFAAVPVEAAATGLSPATKYHLRVVAVNALGTTAVPETTFATFPGPEPEECENAVPRWGPSLRLPDCRAYELVSPPDTGGATPSLLGIGEDDGKNCFAMPAVNAAGDSLIFLNQGGALPGFDGNGFRDEFEASRTGGGWTTSLVSPSGAETKQPSGGACASPDHLYSTLRTGESPFDGGSLVLNGQQTSYLLGPAHSTELVGIGGSATDQDARVRQIGGPDDRVVFTSEHKLEPEAPEFVGPSLGLNDGNNPVTAIYERLPGGPSQVVSLLPNDETTDPTTESVFYEGSSADASATVFKVEEEPEGPTSMYERRAGETQPIAAAASNGGLIFAGVSREGSRAFYVRPDAPGDASSAHIGQLFAFDSGEGKSVAITAAGGASFVNVSADGSHAYFVSPEQLDGGAGSLGGNNLYVWADGSIHFIAGLAESDVSTIGLEPNLREWTLSAVFPIKKPFVGPARDPSRTTPDGSVFVFQSHANLTPYDAAGHSEIYRYDASSQDLSCVSCNPSEAVAVGDAQLHPFIDVGSRANALTEIPNVTEDGRTVVFQTQEALTPGDLNETWDVYAWHDGVTALLSPGRQSQSLLFAMTPDAHDVFFTTKNTVLPEDTSSVDSIYDARVGGGFAPPPVPPPVCADESCQGGPSQPPAFQSPGSATSGGPGNVRHHRHKHKRHHGKHKKGKRHKHNHHHARTRDGRAGSAR
jgi:hypothetical protein